MLLPTVLANYEITIHKTSWVSQCLFHKTSQFTTLLSTQRKDQLVKAVSHKSQPLKKKKKNLIYLLAVVHH